MIERRYQLTLDFKVTVEDITEESVKRDYQDRIGYEEAIADPEFWELIDGQRELLHALTRHEEVLYEFIKRTVVWHVERPDEGIIGPTLGVRIDDEVMLAPVIAELKEDHRSVFEDGIECGELGDYMEQVMSSIQATMTNATLKEVQ